MTSLLASFTDTGPHCRYSLFTSLKRALLNQIVPHTPFCTSSFLVFWLVLNSSFFGVSPVFTEFDLFSLCCQLGKIYQSDFLLTISLPAIASAPICHFLQPARSIFWCKVIYHQFVTQMKYPKPKVVYTSSWDTNVLKPNRYLLLHQSISGKALSWSLMCIIRHLWWMLLCLYPDHSTIMLYPPSYWLMFWHTTYSNIML